MNGRGHRPSCWLFVAVLILAVRMPVKSQLSHTAAVPQPPPREDDATGAPLRLLNHATESMQAAAERMSNRDLGERTLAAQKEAIDAIDELIRLASRQTPPPAEQPHQDQTRDADPDPQDREADAENSPAPNEQTPASDANTGTASDPRDRSDENAANQRAASRRAYIQGVWGHLPPALQQRMLNISRERSLPQYEELVRQYYKALAETRSAESRK